MINSTLICVRREREFRVHLIPPSAISVGLRAVKRVSHLQRAASMRLLFSFIFARDFQSNQDITLVIHCPSYSLLGKVRFDLLVTARYWLDREKISVPTMVITLSSLNLISMAKYSYHTIIL